MRLSNLKPEEAEQILLFDWIRTRKDIAPYAWHIANERRTTLRRGYILKRMGVKPGVADIFIAIPKNGYHGLFIELKAGSNKPTTAQKEFLALMTTVGYAAVCATGYEAARAYIEAYVD